MSIGTIDDVIVKRYPKSVSHFLFSGVHMFGRATVGVLLCRHKRFAQLTCVHPSERERGLWVVKRYFEMKGITLRFVHAQAYTLAVAQDCETRT
jgi:hypothetical protein